MYSDDEDYVLDFFGERNERQRRRRIFRNRPNHFEIWNEDEFITRFRLSKNCVRNVLELIYEDIKSPTERNSSVTPEQMLLLTLRFYATGSFIITAADFCGLSKSTACIVINKVSRAIARILKPLYVKFPQREELLRTRQDFYNIARFPRCVGALDCTHIKIQSPGGVNPEIFRNRKGYFSLNVQTVCDAQLKITNIVCRWPGSTHDSTIFNNSGLRRQFENGQFGDNLLIGDSGYPIKNFLLTPLRHPHTRAEQLYNEAHIRTRNTVERSYGVWKRRFPILAYGIRLKLRNIEPVIISTAVLHNLAISRNDVLPPVDEEVEHIIENNLLDGRYMDEIRRVNENDVTRNVLINDYFSLL